jgi:hypothetical protein
MARRERSFFFNNKTGELKSKGRTVVNASNATNFPEVKGSTTGNPVALNARGDDTNIDINITPKGSGEVNFSSAITMGTNKITGMGDPTANQDAATKAYVDTQTSSIVSTTDIAGDSGTDTVTLGTDTLTFTGGTGITTAVTNNTVTINTSGAAPDIELDSATGDNTTTDFTVTTAPTAAEDLLVTINGLVQRPTTDYTVSGTTLTFTEAPFTGAVVAARTITAASTGPELSADTSPQLGGDLDINGYNIVSTRTNEDIIMIPAGTGDIVLGNFRFDADQSVGSDQDNYVFTYDNSSGKVSLEEAAGGGTTWNEATGNTTMVAGNGYFVDTSSSAITMTLPASPSLGDEVSIIDGAGNAATNNITVGRNSEKIQGDAEDMVVDVSEAAFTLVYYNSTNGWRLRNK